MARISDVTYVQLEEFWNAHAAQLGELETLEEVAQALTDALYNAFLESIVLTRIFGTVAFGALPERDRKIVEDFAKASGVAGMPSDSTTVLSLLGTRGAEDAWNRRYDSVGHLGVPLLSSEFVGGIPMISRLLGEIGFQHSWETENTSQFVTKALANINGIFYVPDARTTLDERQRRIIPATSFVERYGVRSVFGFGGSYLSQTMFITVIIFARDTILRSEAMKFVPMISWLKAGTTRLVKRGAIYRPA